MKTVAYLRNSTTLQKNSINMQRHALMSRSIEMVLPIDEEYVDEDVSARKLGLNQRPALQRLLKEIENNHIESLFVYKRDRLTRKVDEAITIYRLLKEKQVNVIFCADNEPPMQFTTIGEFFELMIAALNEREGDQIIQRIMQTKKTNFLLGKTHGQLPFGYELNKETNDIERNEADLDVVREIYDELNSGKYQTMKEFRHALKSNQALSDKKSWTTQALKTTLMNPTYMGTRMLNFSDEVVKKRFDNLSIIDEASWMNAQDQLTKLLPVPTEPLKENEIVPLLDGHLKCTLCRNALQLNRARKAENLKYQCPSHSNIQLNKQEAEQVVIERTTSFFQRLTKSNFEGLFERYKSDTLHNFKMKMNQQNLEIDKLNQKLIQSTETWFHESNELSRNKLQEKLFKLHSQLEEKKQKKQWLHYEIRELELLENKVSNLHQTISAKDIIQFSEEKKRILLNDLIQLIQVSEHSLSIVFKHPFLETKEAIPIETG